MFSFYPAGFSTAFWCIIWTVYKTPDVPVVPADGRRLSRKRRVSFHEFNRRNRVPLNTIRRNASLGPVVNRNGTIERENSVEKDNSSSFSFDLTARVEKYEKFQ